MHGRGSLRCAWSRCVAGSGARGPEPHPQAPSDYQNEDPANNRHDCRLADLLIHLDDLPSIGAGGAGAPSAPNTASLVANVHVVAGLARVSRIVAHAEPLGRNVPRRGATGRVVPRVAAPYLVVGLELAVAIAEGHVLATLMAGDAAGLKCRLPRWVAGVRLVSTIRCFVIVDPRPV